MITLNNRGQLVTANRDLLQKISGKDEAYLKGNGCREWLNPDSQLLKDIERVLIHNESDIFAPEHTLICADGRYPISKKSQEILNFK